MDVPLHKYWGTCPPVPQGSTPLPPSFFELESHNELEYRYVDDDSSTSRRNFVSFSSAILEITRLECVQTFSSTVISSLWSGTAKHCVNKISDLFHYYSLGSDNTSPGRLHTRLCHAFLRQEHQQKYHQVYIVTNTICKYIIYVTVADNKSV